MKTIKKIIGVLLIASPFIGLGILCWYAGSFMGFLVALVAVLIAIIWLGLKLIMD